MPLLGFDTFPQISLERQGSDSLHFPSFVFHSMLVYFKSEYPYDYTERGSNDNLCNRVTSTLHPLRHNQ